MTHKPAASRFRRKHRLTKGSQAGASSRPCGRPAGRLPAICGVGLVALAAAGHAGAQTPARDAYLGIGIAKLGYEIDVGDVEFIDTLAAGFKVYGGLSLNRRWAFEAAFQTTATDEHSAALAGGDLGAPLVAVPVTATVRLELMTLRALRHHRYAWGSLYAAIGVSGAAIDTEVAVPAVPGLGMSLHTSKNGLTVGAGLQWDLSGLSLRLAYDWWDADMSAVELALHWSL